MKVEISKDLEDLIPGYLDGIRKTVSNLKEYLEKKDWENLRIHGHRMKGSGGGYGFHFITEKGKQIEDAAREESASPIASALEELDQYLASVEIVFVESDDW
ncbi:MAG: Hpt domain-containing protein [Leptospiraceae bacterium]|nr:Hpt domain-containing protein [Leptospiraceae bacterium]MCB1304490.1 Hpt domain-containing protein [Leptospiraceae bacterium]